jgi:hypothetical protein
VTGGDGSGSVETLAVPDSMLTIGASREVISNPCMFLST